MRFNRSLTIISGGDRVGKSTLSNTLKSTKIIHFSEPDPTSPGDIFARYKKAVPEQGESFVWDRSYVCGHILEVFRRQVDPYLPLVVEMELWLYQNSIDVQHVGIVLPWSEIAHRHIAELPSNWSDSAKANELTRRMKEHRFYSEKLIEFYQHTTIFPAILLTSVEEIYEYSELHS